MRILYSHYLADDAHPAVRMVHSIAGELRQQGHEVLIHRSAGPVSPPSPAPPAGAAPAARRGGRLRDAVWFARALARNRGMLARDRRVLAEFGPEVVLARQDAYCISMARAATAAGMPLVTYADAPVAHETRAVPESRFHPPGLVEALERWTLRRSRAIVTVSHPAAELLGRYGLSTPITVVPNGVDPARFPAMGAAERVEARRALGITAPRVAGFVGSFRPFHGIDRLGAIIRAVGPRPDTQWLLIGDGVERPALQASLADRPDVIWLGRRPADEVPRLTALLDVAVMPHPPHAGPFYFCPLKVLEAAAAGCAVVASDQGDIPRLLDGGRCGRVLPAENLELWPPVVRGLLDERSVCCSLGLAAREYVLPRYSWSKTAAEVARVLHASLRDGRKLPQSENRRSK